MTLLNLLSLPSGPKAAPDIVGSAIETVRRHLGMEVAYLSEFVDGQSVFRAVSAPGLEALIKPRDSRPLSEVYCLHILDGRLPKLIPDTRDEPLAMAMPITAAVPIGSHVSVPVRREDGSVYGMFCCLSPRPNPTLTPRDLEVMELFAAISAEQVNSSLAERARRDRIASATRAAILEGRFSILYQPIFDLVTRAPLGFEALCRFQAEPGRGPDLWFAEAAEVGLAAELECAVALRALEALAALPEPFFLSINAAPATVASGALAALLEGRDLPRIVLEVTEQTIVTDYDQIAEQLDRCGAAA